MTRDLTQLESHFAFGANWRAFSGKVGPERVEAALRSLQRLLPRGEIEGRTFLDIGCGAGLSALAALRSGCRHILAVDLDPAAVATTHEMLHRHGGAAFECRRASVFDLEPETVGRFDIVHSWGVLQHTGDMWRALDCAARLVAPEGALAVAIYRRTPLCRAWTLEKRLYAAAPSGVQALLRGLYRSAFLAGLVATGRNPARYLREYVQKRGMHFGHDVHDWLGGYPYDSATEQEVVGFLADRGFSLVRSFTKPPGLGLLGTGCDEFVFRAPAARREAPQPPLSATQTI